MASTFLHDRAAVGTVLECTPPAGDFSLADKPARPIILLSGGVGLTPMVSMMHVIAEAHATTPVWYVHGTRSRKVHALDDQVRGLVNRHGAAVVATVYEHSSDGANMGFVTVDWLRRNTPFDKADIYLCGPRGFLRTLVEELVTAGVPRAEIHFEFFGPTDEVLAA